MSYILDSYTKLYIPFDGTDGDTNDQTATTGQTVSLEGDAQLDTAQKKFGTASLLCDGTGDYATVPDSADWYFGADPFTIDCWIKVTDTTLNHGITGQYNDASNYWFLQYYYSTPSVHGFQFQSVTGGVAKADYAWVATITTGWTHIELARNGANVYFFINGELQTALVNTAISTNEVLDSSGVLEIGASYNHGHVMAGWIDEFRISKGIARHTVNFIPPNEASFLGLF